jgi:hypothetical protein
MNPHCHSPHQAATPCRKCRAPVCSIEECSAAIASDYLSSPRRSIKAVVVAAALMRLLYRGPFARLVSLCRFTYLADAVVYVCFSARWSCRSILSAVALRAHGEQIRRAEIVTAGGDRPSVLLSSMRVSRPRDSDHSTFNTLARLHGTPGRRPAGLSPRQLRTVVRPAW